MQIKCASCGAERSAKHMTPVYVKNTGKFSDSYSLIGNVFVCATRQTCKNRRKAMRQVDKLMDEWAATPSPPPAQAPPEIVRRS